MKKLLLILGLILAIQPVMADKKKGKEEGPKDIQNPKEFIAGIEWESPERTDYESVNAYYDKCDSLYTRLKDIGDKLVFYDVMMIANEETGDTIVAVVDDEGNIRSGYAAFNQYFQASLLGANLATYGMSVITNGTLVLTDLPNIVMSNPLKAASIAKAVKKVSKQTAKLAGVVPAITKSFKQQKNKIRAYVKKADEVESLSDPSLRSIPELALDESAVLVKSNQEITESLSQVQSEDEKYKLEDELLKNMEEEDLDDDI